MILKRKLKHFRTYSNLFTKNKDEIDAYWSKLRILEHKGIQLFTERVREEYAVDVSKELWDLCWSTAYKTSHGYEYDEIAKTARNLVNFANEVIMIHTNNGRIKQ